ncbi:MAG: site-2 protease family protein [Candidatus Bilamarchaeaceae archaeon]
MFITTLIVILSLIFFYLVLSLPISGLLKFLLIALEMYLVGVVLAKRYKLSTEMGFILLKSKKGITFINNLAKNHNLWNSFADIGLIVSYGFLGALIFKKHFSWKTFIVGVFLLTFISFLVAPTALHFLSSVLTGGFAKKATFDFGGPDINFIVITALFYAGGFFLMLLAGILYYSTNILFLLIQFIFFGSQAIASTPAGGTLLLPGINLPLVEGILALAVVLLVHEGAHAVLSRIASIPLLSSGIVLFGIIPIGAFIEPDEKRLAKSPAQRQTRILVAGSTANFITSIIFFFMFIPISVLLKTQAAGTLIYDIVRFFYVFIGLTFSLNFVVATVNILPLPLFDGYRLLEVNIKNKTIVSALMYITLIAFLLNFLPWFFAH